METWQKDVIEGNLTELLKLTHCSPILLAELKKHKILSDNEADLIDCKSTSQEKTKWLYQIAENKTGGFDALYLALEKEKQTGALEIFREGYEKEGKPKPSSDEESLMLTPENLKFSVGDQVYTLSDLIFREQHSDVLQQISGYLKCCREVSVNGINHLFLNDVPPPPKYYIQRKVRHNTQIRGECFSQKVTQDHIFLFKGDINKRILLKLRSHSDSDSESFQLIQKEDNFQKFCQKYSTKAVHLIEYKNNSYFWIKSSRSVNIFQNFVIPGSDPIWESEMIEKLTRTTSRKSICISDTPGMGKTTLLRHLFANIRPAKTFSVFLELSKFVRTITNIIDSPAATAKALASFVSYNEISMILLENMLLHGNYQFDLFLDGYDEVTTERKNIVNEFLKHVQHLKGVRVLVTTRPHSKAELENILNVLSYEILPFDAQTQVEFLTNYWIKEHRVDDTTSLREYANLCLNTLKKNITDVEREFAGVPLQCWMLAEIYAKDSAIHDDSGDMSAAPVNISSIFDLYESLVEFKFQRLEDSMPASLSKKQRKIQRNAYVQFHVIRALELLFPEWLPKLIKHLSLSEKPDESTIYHIGLIEKRSSTTRPEFVHRTFAEYMLAKFLIKIFPRCGTAVELVFGTLLGKNKIKVIEDWNRPNLYVLPYPTITYFMEILLRQPVNRSLVDETFVAVYLKSVGYTHCDIIPALVACCCDGFEFLFTLTSKIFTILFRNFCLEYKTDYDIEDHVESIKYVFKVIPHLAAEKFGNMTIIKTALHLSSSLFEMSLMDHLFQPDGIHPYTGPWIPDCTPLHVAVHNGNLELVMNLLSLYEKNVRQLKYLLHVCVEDTLATSVEGKLLIVEELVEQNPALIMEEFDGRPPILENRVHLQLLKRLQSLGADINAHWEYGTILHMYVDKNTYPDLLEWALLNNFSQINKPDKFGWTPLFDALDQFGDILEIYMTIWRNLPNHLEENWSGERVSRLLSYMATAGFKRDWFYDEICRSPVISALDMFCNDLGTSDHELSSKVSLEEIIDFLHATGIKFDIWDLHYCVKHVHNAEIACKIIHYGAEISSPEKPCRTVLHTAARHGNHLVLEMLLKKLDVNAVDEEGYTPLHHLYSKHRIALENYDLALKILLENGAQMDQKDNDELFSLSKWISNKNLPLNFLCNFKDKVSPEIINSDVATQALAFLLGRLFLTKDNFSDAERESIRELICFLKQCDGHLTLGIGIRTVCVLLNLAKGESKRKEVGSVIRSLRYHKLNVEAKLDVFESLLTCYEKYVKAGRFSVEVELIDNLKDRRAFLSSLDSRLEIGEFLLDCKKKHPHISDHLEQLQSFLGTFSGY